MSAWPKFTTPGWSRFRAPTVPVELDPTHPLSVGCVGYWPLLHDANDISGYRTPSVPNAVPFEVSALGGAGMFNGSSSYVDLGTPAQLNFTTDFSVCADFVFTSTPPSSGAIYAKGYNLTNTQFQLQITSANELSFNEYNGSTNGATTSFALSFNTVYKTVGIYTNSEWLIYINGALVASAVAAGPVTNAMPSSIGAVWSANNNAFIQIFPGTINNVTVYNRVLSPDECVLRTTASWAATRPRIQRIYSIPSAAFLAAYGRAMAASRALPHSTASATLLGHSHAASRVADQITASAALHARAQNAGRTLAALGAALGLHGTARAAGRGSAHTLATAAARGTARTSARALPALRATLTLSGRSLAISRALGVWSPYVPPPSGPIIPTPYQPRVSYTGTKATIFVAARSGIVIPQNPTIVMPG